MKSLSSAFNCASVQAALKAQRDSVGKQTKPCHYVNEVKLLRYALTGSASTACDFSNPPAERLQITRRVICLNRRLIKAHVPRKERKQACRDFVLKQQAKEMQQSRLNTNSDSPITKSLGTENDQ
jgi:hypothetical protein